MSSTPLEVKTKTIQFMKLLYDAPKGGGHYPENEKRA